MKVKVRKRKPAPVGKEQVSKTIDIIKDEFNGEFGVPKEVSLYYRCKMLREEMRKVKESAKGNNDILSRCNNSSASLEKTEKAISSNSYPFLTHDVGGRGHRNKKLVSIAANQTSSGVYVPRIFIDYISGSFNDKDIRKAMENIRKIRNTIRVNGICGNKPSAFERR